jgi:hypothetical protein
VILPEPVRLYCCYAERNRTDWNELSANLAVLIRLGMIEIRHNHGVPAGHDLSREYFNHLDASDIVLLLISHYFFDSDLCWELMCQAMARHNAGKLRVVPVLLSLVDYEGTPIDRLRMLPQARPINRRQAAYVDVVQGIRRIIQDPHGGR